MKDEIAKCPNPECASDKGLHRALDNDGYASVRCMFCHYQGPRAYSFDDAIRLHNLICSPDKPSVPAETLEKLVADWNLETDTELCAVGEICKILAGELAAIIRSAK